MRKAERLLVLILFLCAICFIKDAVSQAQSLAGKPLSTAEIDQLQAEAQAGDSTAQLNLGKAYENGNGVPQNDELAVKWYRAAAEQGSACTRPVDR